MTDILEPTDELRELEARLRTDGLTAAEAARLEELRNASPPSVPAPGGDSPAPAPEEPTAVLWEAGPVEEPAAPLADLVAGSPAELATWDAPPDAPGPAVDAEDPGPPPLPPPDPAFAGVVVEDAEEHVPEVLAEDLEEIVDEVPAPTVEVATVSFLDEEGPVEDVVSLDALLATPPPPAAESLAPPLPPPLPPAPPSAGPPPVVPPPAPSAAGAFAASPSFVSGEHRVVLHTVEGQVLRGSLANADLADVELPLLQPNGAVARVPAEQVKAIFFMLPPDERPVQAAGTRVRLTFGDGRQLSGLSPDYAPDSPGFFVLPLDTRTHTARVWVFRAAVRQLTVG